MSVRTSITDLNVYLEHIKRTTNMQCLTPDSALSGDCNFLAANLYAKSVFGEDALANLSIEKGPDGQVCQFKLYALASYIAVPNLPLALFLGFYILFTLARLINR